MEQAQQNTAQELTAQAIPQQAVEDACFHSLGLIGRNCEYLEQHLARVGADAQSLQAVSDISAATAKLERTINELLSALEFLRAGGRVSNVAFLGAKLLNLHPVIEILDGKLVATKKYRGKMKKVAVQMVTEYAEKYNLERDCLWFVWVVGFPDAVRQAVEEAAKALGFKKTRWIQAGGVITTHGGPAAFGLAGFSEVK